MRKCVRELPDIGDIKDALDRAMDVYGDGEGLNAKIGIVDVGGEGLDLPPLLPSIQCRVGYYQHGKEYWTGEGRTFSEAWKCEPARTDAEEHEKSVANEYDE
ncbi:MAG: hypothetical protein M0R80_26220 [Proteobacteria bacterium]|jgi:hypothetical protein|nr:hypothetical protein [Pseudomonadota bacterium]